MVALKDRFLKIADQLGSSEAQAQAFFRAIRVRYRQPRRFYHTLYGHIGFCFRQWDEVQSLAQNPLAVQLAIACHDVVYDPQAFDNVEQSILWMKRVLTDLGGDRGIRLAEDVEPLIRTTNHNDRPREGDEALISDIDLAILGQPPSVYKGYARKIRQEYAFVPWKNFCERRSQLLERFIKRPAIYDTSFFMKRYEPAAQRNVSREIQRMRRFC